MLYFRSSKTLYKWKKFGRLTIALGISHLNKLVCKSWYETAIKCGTHRHLGGWHKPKPGYKSKKKIRKFDCSMKYLLPKETKVLRHFTEIHFVDGFSENNPDISPTRLSADRQFADRYYFDRDYTSVSHLIGLHRQMYFAMYIILSNNGHKQIKIHILMLAVPFNLYPCQVLDSITDLGVCCINFEMLYLPTRTVQCLLKGTVPPQNGKIKKNFFHLYSIILLENIMNRWFVWK